MGRGSRRALLLLLLMLGLGLCCSSTGAQREPDRIAFHLGEDGLSDPDKLLRAGAEYRFGVSRYGVHPHVGISVTDSVDLYTYVGLRYPIRLGERWTLTPAGSVGFFKDDGGLDLGGRVQFRSAAELSYRLDDRSRIGLEFWHVSNSNLAEFNPGTESLLVTYSIELGR